MRPTQAAGAFSGHRDVRWLGLNAFGVARPGAPIAHRRAARGGRSRLLGWLTRYGARTGLELDDQTLREWDAVVLAAWAGGPDEPGGIVLDRSAFYRAVGGQPPDHGVLLWGGVQTRIEGVRKGDDLYLIPAEGD